MAISTKETGSAIDIYLMAMGDIVLKTVAFMKEHGKKTRCMEKAVIDLRMDGCIQVNIVMVIDMVKESSSSPMARPMSESFAKESLMDMEYFRGLMGVVTKGIGAGICSMVMEN